MVQIVKINLEGIYTCRWANLNLEEGTSKGKTYSNQNDRNRMTLGFFPRHLRFKKILHTTYSLLQIISPKYHYVNYSTDVHG